MVLGFPQDVPPAKDERKEPVPAATPAPSAAPAASPAPVTTESPVGRSETEPKP